MVVVCHEMGSCWDDYRHHDRVSALKEQCHLCGAEIIRIRHRDGRLAKADAKQARVCTVMEMDDGVPRIEDIFIGYIVHTATCVRRRKK